MFSRGPIKTDFAKGQSYVSCPLFVIVIKIVCGFLKNLKDWPEFHGQPFNGQQNFQSMTLGRVIIT